jgi:DNA-binding NarL/FixJ family response regulator
MAIKVVIVEDHHEFRESISYVLQSTEGFRCTGSYLTVNDALNHMKPADVILLDINLPGIKGTEGVPLFKKAFPNTAIIMLTVYEDDQNIFDAILGGADGYLLKKTPPLRLLQAIEDAHQGGAPMTPSIAKRTLALFKEKTHLVTPAIDLSNREQEILSLIVEGYSNEEISEKLFISYQTVRNHIRHIYEKLHVHSKSQAVAKALKTRIV